MFSPFIFSRSTSWLDGSWEKKKIKKKTLAGCTARIRRGETFFFAFPWNNAHPPHPAASRWRNNASRRRKGIYNDIFERAGVGYLNFIETANNNDFHPRVERRKSKPSPGYDCSPPARARDASVPRWREKKREEEKKSIIYFAQTKQRATDMVDGERIKENVPLFRKGWLSIDGNCQSLPDRE